MTQQSPKWLPTFLPFKPEDQELMDNPDKYIERMEGLRAGVISDTASILHSFAHIGDSPEHDPLRVQDGFEIMENSRRFAQGLITVLLHPQTPEVVKEDVIQTLLVLTTTGLIAADTHHATLNWDAIKAQKHPDVPKVNPVDAIFDLLDKLDPKNQSSNQA